jgi:hypothetical protein
MLLWVRVEDRPEHGSPDRLKLSLVIPGVGAWLSRKDSLPDLSLDWGPFQNFWSNFL